MRKDQMVNVIKHTLLETSDGFVKPGVIGFSCPYQGEDKLQLAAEAVLAAMLEEGMLEPLKECKLIPDDMRGGMKHSPAERGWDE